MGGGVEPTMRRLRILRRLLASLVVALAMAILGLSSTLWVRSRSVGDHPSLSVRLGAVPDRFLLLELFSTRAGLSLNLQSIGTNPADLGAAHWSHHQRVYWDWHTWSPPGGRRPAAGPLSARLGFNYGRQSAADGGGWMRFVDRSWVAFPHWFPVLLASLPLALAARRLLVTHRQTRRAKEGLCPICGYDLRGSADRCPECGSPAPVRLGIRSSAGESNGFLVP